MPVAETKMTEAIRRALPNLEPERTIHDLRLQTFWKRGYPVRALIDSVGLQLVDVYLGLWRQLRFNGEALFGITSQELGRHRVQETEWLSEP